MQQRHLHLSTLMTLGLVVVVGQLTVEDAEARGGRGGGGGMRGGGGGARTSVSRPSGGGGGAARSSGATRSAGSYDRSTRSADFNTNHNQNINRNVNRDVSRDVNRDIDRDVDVDGDWGYYGGGGYYRGAPIARGIAFGAAAGITAAAIGSVAYSLPSGCGTVYTAGYPYYNCAGTYYAPQYSGSDVTYVVVESPEDD